MAFLYPVTSQVKGYIDPRDGSPLNGTLRFGIAGQDPEATTVEVYWDVAGTQPVPQPIRVRNGFAIRGRTPANVFADGDFSAIARDTRNRLVYTVPNSSDIQLALAVTGLGTAAAVGITDAGGFYTSTNVEGALQEVGTSFAAASAALLAAVPTGVCWAFCGTTAPAGFVLESGRTIGNASSGGTERANADTANLFTLLWNSSTNAQLPIQDSAGVLTTRGASAANDFTANKRLPVPDGRGMVHAGKDNMGGTTAGRITVGGAGFTGTTQFASGGTETHVLTTAQLAAHTHVQNAHTHVQDTHNHAQNAHTHGVVDAGHTHNFNLPDTITENIQAAADAARGYSKATNTLQATSAASINPVVSISNATAVNVTIVATNQNTTAVNQNAGTDTAHQNAQPTIIYTRIIRL